MRRTNPLSIKEIRVDKLFGYYTYKIPVKKASDISQLLIIYGDNGSGKTTLLKLVFWLLSSRDKSGYKSKIAKTKFRSFSVIFENGIEIGAQRDKSQSIGAFTYYIKKGSKTIFSVQLKTTPDNVINIEPGSKDNLTFLGILQFIRELNISVFYLSDDRKILNSVTSSVRNPESYGEIILNESDIILAKDYERTGLKKMLEEKKLALEPAIERLTNWIRNKMIFDSRTGDKNSQAIYMDLIKNVAEPMKKIDGFDTREQLIEEIKTIEKKVAPYVELGLLDHLNSQTITKSIKSSKTQTQLKNLRAILAPYIESVNAKLNALEQLKDALQLFLTSTNDYFTNKEIKFKLNKGFSLLQFGDEVIDFNLLSSGEKQLLLLFINTITSADVATIFIIDEPEISLNIKWQRNLIDTLLKFSEGKNIQYILSTHSLELLSSNLDHVTRLEGFNGRS